LLRINLSLLSIIYVRMFSVILFNFSDCCLLQYSAGTTVRSLEALERVPYLSALKVCSRRRAIQIYVYLYLYYCLYLSLECMQF